MKKAFLLAGVLFISVISTACINNFAVQELNNKAKTFMDNGDYNSAIERLKSSIDLDEEVFETHYNLAVAYTNAEDYLNAVKSYNDAIKLKPDFMDAYYSLAVCEANLAKDIISGELIVLQDGTLEKSEIDNDKKVNLSDDAKILVKEYLADAISNYKKYLSESQQDSEDIEEEIEELTKLLDEYNK